MQSDGHEFQDAPIVAGALRCMAVALTAWAIGAIPPGYGWWDFTYWVEPVACGILAVCVFRLSNPIASIVTGHRVLSSNAKSSAIDSWMKFAFVCMGLYVAWRYLAPTAVHIATTFGREITASQAEVVHHVVDVGPGVSGGLLGAKLLCYTALTTYLLLGREYVAQQLRRFGSLNAADTRASQGRNRP